MFTATLTTLAAAAALSAQTVTANTQVSPNTVSAATTTAITAPAKPSRRPAVRIPGTFDVVAGQDALEGVTALYVVHTGDA